MLCAALPGLAKCPVRKVGDCPCSCWSSGDYCVPSKNSKMPPSEQVTPALVVIENRTSTALPIRWLSSDFMVKKGVCSQAVVMKNLVFGCAVALLVVTPLGGLRAEQKGWQEVRDDFLQDDSEFVQFHCGRGQDANEKSMSAFNDEWVKNIQMLRFEGGVATQRADSSNLFFSGLSMAMKSRCPGVW